MKNFPRLSGSSNDCTMEWSGEGRGGSRFTCPTQIQLDQPDRYLALHRIADFIVSWIADTVPLRHSRNTSILLTPHRTRGSFFRGIFDTKSFNTACIHIFMILNRTVQNVTPLCRQPCDCNPNAHSHCITEEQSCNNIGIYTSHIIHSPPRDTQKIIYRTSVRLPVRDEQAIVHTTRWSIRCDVTYCKYFKNRPLSITSVQTIDSYHCVI